MAKRSNKKSVSVQEEVAVVDQIKTTDPVQEEVVQSEVLVEEPVVTEPEVVEQVQEEVVTEPVVEEGSMSQEQIDQENAVVALESEIVRVQDQLAELRKQLRALTKPEKTDGPSKMEVCIKLFKDNKGMARKDLIKLFIDEGGLTLAGAKTYVQSIMTKEKTGKLA